MTIPKTIIIRIDGRIEEITLDCEAICDRTARIIETGLTLNKPFEFVVALQLAIQMLEKHYYYDTSELDRKAQNRIAKNTASVILKLRDADTDN